MRTAHRRTVTPKPPFTIPQILTWADAFHALRRHWPTRDDGRLAGSLGETWMAVYVALQKGRSGRASVAALASVWREEPRR